MNTYDHPINKWTVLQWNPTLTDSCSYLLPTIFSAHEDIFTWTLKLFSYFYFLNTQISETTHYTKPTNRVNKPLFVRMLSKQTRASSSKTNLTLVVCKKNTKRKTFKLLLRIYIAHENVMSTNFWYRACTEFVSNILTWNNNSNPRRPTGAAGRRLFV